ncbi:hypothetical protein TRFO_03102 [Tritrichomonas foetus]|uniref:RING-type domain-containing protein n=1 Tax=Tritrichomonas foetus TaxID=1144522 RepID=A0A1J4KWK9_9EUKA|nr:hypothetical protein TRFO_03102 [Tritrichomonas foetus]|eukprot:OHT14100.1 hypothetical protein TRFO_03102 [Tritrichomonas foetus]
MRSCLLCRSQNSSISTDKCWSDVCNLCVDKIKAKSKKNSTPSKRKEKYRLMLKIIRETDEEILKKYYSEPQKDVSKPRIKNIFEEEEEDDSDPFSGSIPQAKIEPMSPIITIQTNSSNNQAFSSIHPLDQIDPNRPVNPKDFIFQGKVRNFNDSEIDHDFTCEHCGQNIDPTTFYLPVVILNCGHFVYHRECFARMMAAGRVRCPKCTKLFFTRKSSD